MVFLEHAGTEKLKYLQWSSTCSEKCPAKLHILFGIQSVGQELLTNWKVPRASYHSFAPFFCLAWFTVLQCMRRFNLCVDKTWSAHMKTWVWIAYYFFCFQAHRVKLGNFCCPVILTWYILHLVQNIWKF